MSYLTSQTIQRLMPKFVEDELAKLSPAERQQFEQGLEDYFNGLLKSASDKPAHDPFVELIGLGETPEGGFDDLPETYVSPDFDEAVVPAQLHAAADLYYIYQHERMKVFQVVDTILRLFHMGKIRIQRGPGARGLYLLEKWRPLRYNLRDRMIAYRRAFNYGNADAPAGAVVNRNFHRQFVGLMVAIAQYYRDLFIGEVIRGGQTIEQRPFGSVATIQRIALDLRWALDRSTYGNIFSLAMEARHYLQTVLQLFDSADIKKAFDANTKWDVVEIVSNRYLGGVAEPSQRAKMAESGRRVINFAADPDALRTAIDPILFQSLVRPVGTHAESWIAAYRMTPEGRGFPGVFATLRDVVGAGATVR